MADATPPKVFISYSWEDNTHNEWVVEFATRLRENSVDAKLDIWELKPGSSVTKFMERAVRENDYVLMICTPEYKRKVDEGLGGVEYEVEFMKGEVLEEKNREKFIPILRKGESKNSIPYWLKTSLFLDLRGDSLASEFDRLLSYLYGTPPKVPSVNPNRRDLTGMDLTPKELIEAREKYLRKFIEKYSKPERPAILELGAYINLPVGVGDSPTQDEKSKDFDSIFAISKLPKKWILLGDAGSGKTATIRDLACFQAKECLDNPKSPIPVLINLWTWRGESSTFSNFFEDSIDDSSNQDLFGLLRNLHDTPLKLLHENKLSLYLDGLDELPDSKVRLLKEWLSKTDLSVGITCRESDFIGIRKFELPSISIKSLGWDQITIFAEKFLGESTGSEFVSNVVEAKAGEKMYEDRHLFRFVQTPFFLLLILAYYKQSGKVEFNRWKLFEYIVGKLWEGDRIQELLTRYKLAKDYSASSQIVRFLSSWGMNFIQNQIIDRKQFEKNTNGRLLEVLVESTLIQMNEDQIRFRHPLFADYFAANHALEWAEYGQLSDDISKWADMLVILAGFSERTREKVRKFLVDYVSSRTGSEGFMEEKREGLWILGEVGDSNVIPLLIDLHNKTKNATDAWMLFMVSSANHIFAGTSCLTAAGRISRRLPDNDKNKQEFIQVVVKELFSDPKAENWDDINIDNILDDSEKKEYPWMTRQQNLLNIWNSALAIGEMGGLQASKILYEGLLHFNKSFPQRVMWSNNVRVLGFSVALARLGISGIPTLLDILSSEDPQISHVAADALYILIEL